MRPHDDGVNWVNRNRWRVVTVTVFLTVAALFWLGVPSAIGAMLTDENSALSTVLDVGDKVGGIVAAVFAVRSAVRPAPPAVTRVGSSSVAARWDGAAGLLVDRADERSRLRAAVRSRRSRVIIVYGEPGVGKTHLVRQVLQEMRITVLAQHMVPMDVPSADTILRAFDGG